MSSSLGECGCCGPSEDSYAVICARVRGGWSDLPPFLLVGVPGTVFYRYRHTAIGTTTGTYTEDYTTNNPGQQPPCIALVADGTADTGNIGALLSQTLTPTSLIRVYEEIDINDNVTVVGTIEYRDELLDGHTWQSLVEEVKAVTDALITGPADFPTEMRSAVVDFDAGTVTFSPDVGGGGSSIADRVFIENFPCDAVCPHPEFGVKCAGAAVYSRSWVKIVAVPYHISVLIGPAGCTQFDSTPIGTYQLVQVDPVDLNGVRKLGLTYGPC